MNIFSYKNVSTEERIEFRNTVQDTTEGVLVYSDVHDKFYSPNQVLELGIRIDGSYIPFTEFSKRGWYMVNADGDACQPVRYNEYTGHYTDEENRVFSTNKTGALHAMYHGCRETEVNYEY